MTAKHALSWTNDDTIIRGRKRLIEKLYLIHNPVRAAAPDLLAACREAEGIFQLRGLTGLAKRMTEVIAKAEGK